MGARDIVGADFSEVQIARARARAFSAGVADRVTFRLADVSSLERELGPFDLVVIHAFLHHLAVDELRDVVSKVAGLLRPTGRLILLEPVVYPVRRPSHGGQVLLALFRTLIRLGGLRRYSFGSRRLAVRRQRLAETAARELMAKRDVGVPPRGPSPKELPFSPGELPSLLAPWFRVDRHRRCLALSQTVAQETLFLELSSPKLARAIRWPLLFFARQLDHMLLRREPPPDVWVFELFDCSLAVDNAGESA
jgi:SAM-dependent methyltransferase